MSYPLPIEILRSVHLQEKVRLAKPMYAVNRKYQNIPSELSKRFTMDESEELETSDTTNLLAPPIRNNSGESFENSESSETVPAAGKNIETEEEKIKDEDNDEDDIYGIGVSENDGMITDLPKMRTRFSMSSQQILDLIDPYNQKPFQESIARINHLLENTQKDYCAANYKQPDNETETKVFHISCELLEKLVYEDELDLPGNFLRDIIGRRLNDEDMSILAEFLSKENRVSRLNLAYNDIGDEGALVFAGALLTRTDIVHVNLGHNNLTPTGCSQFFEYLMQRSALHSLKMSGIKMGQEGFDALTCLVMCGRGPCDLDVSETDMSTEDFQGLSSSWQCLDRNDVPKFLKDHTLPIPIEVLVEMKIANNEIKSQEYTLMQRRSLVELIKYDAGGGDMASESMMQRMPEIPKEALQDTVELVEKVSATILEGLFEIPQILGNDGDFSKESTLNEDHGKVDEIAKDADGLPDTSLMIEEYKRIKDINCVPFDSDGNPVIVCPSLYSLEVDNVLEIETEGARHIIPSALDNVVEGALEMTLREGRTGAADDETALNISGKVVTRVLLEAARFSTMTDYQEKSDASQVLLALVLQACQKAKELQDSSAEFQEEDLKAIWEVATTQAVNIVYNKIPSDQCSLTPNEVTAFVRKFMESANRTLLRLLQNPFIPPLLYDVGTRSCRETLSNQTSSSMSVSEKTSLNIEPNNAQKIAMSFLEGVIETAADLIATGDPFHFRRRSDASLADALKKSQMAVDAAEKNVKGAVEDFILAGATLAVDARELSKDLETVIDGTIDPAVQYLELAFDQVANLIIETENQRKDDTPDKALEKEREKKDNPLEKYAFISRPTRLVLNRPIFQDFEPTIMGAKMGEFLRTNASLRCLHIRKWNLGEEGMINLMDGLNQSNSNIVLLDLSSNAIGAEGTKLLAKFVQKNASLKHLLLGYNCLRNPGLTYLTEVLPYSSVEFLNIAFNDIAESLEAFFEELPHTKIRAVHAIGNHFNQKTWLVVKNLMDTEWLIKEYCDFTLQDVDGNGMIVKNSQIRDVNEWYDVAPKVPKGLYRSPYFEETAHILATQQGTL